MMRESVEEFYKEFPIGTSLLIEDTIHFGQNGLKCVVLEVKVLDYTQSKRFVKLRIFNEDHLPEVEGWRSVLCLDVKEKL